MLGIASSFWIVPVPLVPSVAFTGFDSTTLKFSHCSKVMSPTTSTSIVVLLVLGWIVTVPDAAT